VGEEKEVKRGAMGGSGRGEKRGGGGRKGGGGGDVKWEGWSGG